MDPQKRELKIQDCGMKFFVDISPGKGSEEKKVLTVNVLFI